MDTLGAHQVRTSGAEASLRHRVAEKATGHCLLCSGSSGTTLVSSRPAAQKHGVRNRQPCVRGVLRGDGVGRALTAVAVDGGSAGASVIVVVHVSVSVGAYVNVLVSIKVSANVNVIISSNVSVGVASTPASVSVS